MRLSIEQIAAIRREVSLAAGDAAQEAIWLRSVLNELDLTQHDATVIFEDNQGCIALTVNSGQHQRTKHIDIRHHFIKQLVEENKIILTYLPTEQMVADIFTKPLARTRYATLRDALLNTTSLSSGSVVDEQAASSSTRLCSSCDKQLRVATNATYQFSRDASPECLDGVVTAV